MSKLERDPELPLQQWLEGLTSTKVLDASRVEGVQVDALVDDEAAEFSHVGIVLKGPVVDLEGNRWTADGDSSGIVLSREEATFLAVRLALCVGAKDYDDHAALLKWGAEMVTSR